MILISFRIIKFLKTAISSILGMRKAMLTVKNDFETFGSGTFSKANF